MILSQPATDYIRLFLLISILGDLQGTSLRAGARTFTSGIAVGSEAMHGVTPQFLEAPLWRPCRDDDSTGRLVKQSLPCLTCQQSTGRFGMLQALHCIVMMAFIAFSTECAGI